MLKIDSLIFNINKNSPYRNNLLKAKSIDAIEKIAENKNLNLFINISDNNELLQDKLVIMAMTTKPHSFDRGAARTFVNKNAKTEEISVKLYNVAMMAIEAFEKKFKKIYH